MEPRAESRRGQPRLRIHGDRQQHSQGPCDGRPTLPAHPRRPPPMGPNRRRHGPSQPLRPRTGDRTHSAIERDVWLSQFERNHAARLHARYFTAGASAQTQSASADGQQSCERPRDEASGQLQLERRGRQSRLAREELPSAQAQEQEQRFHCEPKRDLLRRGLRPTRGVQAVRGDSHEYVQHGAAPLLQKLIQLDVSM
jgi:hypothetical protein